MSDAPQDSHPPLDSERYQELLARESQLTWERSWVRDGAPSHLIDRTAWAEARRRGPNWWQPVIDPDITWGRELALVLAEARGRVLELGCGGGWLSLELARRGLQVTGLDACEPLITAAQEYAAKQGFAPDQLSFQIADLNTVSLPERSYDTVIAWQALHHLMALPRLMQEVTKTLRPGGCLLVCDTLLDHDERGLSRSLLALPRKAAKLLLLLTALAGRLGRAAPPAGEEEPEACRFDSPFEGVGATSIEPALDSAFRPVISWRSGTWFWEGLPQYAFTIMSGSRWQQWTAVTLLRLFRAVDALLLRLGLPGNYLAGRYLPR